LKARFDSTAAQAPAAAGDGDGVAAGATEARHRTRSLDLDTLRVVADRYGILIAWAIVIAVFGVLEPDTFLTTGILNAILGTQAVLLMLALGVMIPLTVGEFDLSVAGTLGLSYVLIGYLTINHHWPLEASILVALATGVVVGAVNAFFIVGLGVESIIVTLGMGTVLLGISNAFLVGPVVGLPSGFVSAIGDTQLLGVPIRFYFGLALTVIVWYVYSFTPLGRYMFFVGTNRSVARLVGIRVTAIRIGALMTSALVASVTAVVLAGATGAADASTANGYLLPMFAAVFLGATTITPGRFNAWGTLIAVYFLTTGVTGLELQGLTGWVEQVFYGGSLVIAVALSRLAGRQSVWSGL
jgi:ribose transport system permease protein